jgi:hypothetical protein
MTKVSVGGGQVKKDCAERSLFVWPQTSQETRAGSSQVSSALPGQELAVDMNVVHQIIEALA